MDRTALNFTNATENVLKIPENMMLIWIQVAHISYKDMENLEFQMVLINNYYANLNRIHICFPMKIGKSLNESSDIDTDVIPVNNFFLSFS